MGRKAGHRDAFSDRFYDHLLAFPQLRGMLDQGAQARLRHAEVATGRFGAMMQVELVNDGPVTFWLRSKPAEAHA